MEPCHGSGSNRDLIVVCMCRCLLETECVLPTDTLKFVLRTITGKSLQKNLSSSHSMEQQAIWSIMVGIDEFGRSHISQKVKVKWRKNKNTNVANSGEKMEYTL